MVGQPIVLGVDIVLPANARVVVPENDRDRVIFQHYFLVAFIYAIVHSNNESNGEQA